MFCAHRSEQMLVTMKPLLNISEENARREGGGETQRMTVVGKYQLSKTQENNKK
jgi:hypothetical protein